MAERTRRISTTTKIKMAVVVLLLILAVILIAQNWQDATVQIFWATVTMPRAILLTLMLVIGFVIGAMSTWGYLHRR